MQPPMISSKAADHTSSPTSLPTRAMFQERSSRFSAKNSLRKYGCGTSRASRLRLRTYTARSASGALSGSHATSSQREPSTFSQVSVRNRKRLGEVSSTSAVTQRLNSESKLAPATSAIAFANAKVRCPLRPSASPSASPPLVPPTIRALKQRWPPGRAARTPLRNCASTNSAPAIGGPYSGACKGGRPFAPSKASGLSEFVHT
mmetsp:Transcript_100845/g.178949  ORF Transcript_100845/g.178949 Transcript_100845/m.178949 type:complete len:204 (+) Transcript_100845:774-1385(+)